MVHKVVESATCDQCGKVFTLGNFPSGTKNPARALYNHQKKVNCFQAQRRRELDEFRRTLTMEQVQEHKRLRRDEKEGEKLRREMDKLKAEVRALRSEVQEKDTLRLTIINISPKIVAYQPKLNPIQILESLDWTEERFRAILSRPYPYPQYGLSIPYTGNAETYRQKVRDIQSLVPLSVRDEQGRVFYKDEDVMKMDDSETVNMRILQAIRSHDEEADKAYSALKDRTPESEGFRSALLSKIRDVHLDVL